MFLQFLRWLLANLFKIAEPKKEAQMEAQIKDEPEVKPVKKPSEPLKQNSPGLYPTIQKVGCFFRSACRMAEYAAELINKPCRFSAEDLNRLWDESNERAYIVNNMMKNSAGVANLALAALGVPGKFVEVATFQDGAMNWYGAVKNRRADFFIQKIKTKYEEGTHFRNVSSMGLVMFDPYEPPIEPLDIFYTICYRFDEGDK